NEINARSSRSPRFDLLCSGVSGAKAGRLGHYIDSERNDTKSAFARCKNLSIKLNYETIGSDESRLGAVKKMRHIGCKANPAMLGTNDNTAASIDPVARRIHRHDTRGVHMSRQRPAEDRIRVI